MPHSIKDIASLERIQQYSSGKQNLSLMTLPLITIPCRLISLNLLPLMYFFEFLVLDILLSFGYSFLYLDILLWIFFSLSRYSFLYQVSEIPWPKLSYSKLFHSPLLLQNLNLSSNLSTNSNVHLCSLNTHVSVIWCVVDLQAPHVSWVILEICTK